MTLGNSRFWCHDIGPESVIFFYSHCWLFLSLILGKDSFVCAFLSFVRVKIPINHVGPQLPRDCPRLLTPTVGFHLKYTIAPTFMRCETSNFRFSSRLKRTQGPLFPFKSNYLWSDLHRKNRIFKDIWFMVLSNKTDEGWFQILGICRKVSTRKIESLYWLNKSVLQPTEISFLVKWNCFLFA